MQSKSFKLSVINFIAAELGGDWKNYFFQGSTFIYLSFKYKSKSVTLNDYEIKERVSKFANIDEDNIRIHKTELGKVFIYNANLIGFVKSDSDGTISWKNL